MGSGRPAERLMVTPYPPYRDGIGTYAVQEVRRMRAAGTPVEVLSPLPSAAHHHLALGGLRGILALVKRARPYQSVVIQFSPEMLFGACHGPAERVAVWAGLEALARVTDLEIRLHEIEFGPLRRNPAERFMAARALRAAQVSVHTKAEIDNLEAILGLDPGLIVLVEHGQHFGPATTESRVEARHELGLDPSEHVFVAIGFLQEHKGFDRAVRAFARAELEQPASLHVVGSVRVDHPDLVAYARRLDRLCTATPGVTLHQRYVSDAEFDRWIVAADTVVLPYREIWSSSVMERAKLYRRTIIAADVGGLGDQAPGGALLFASDEGLIQALRQRAAATDQRPQGGASMVDGRAVGSPPPEWEVEADAPDPASIEDQIKARVRGRGLAEAAESRGWHAPGPGSALDPLLALDPLQRQHAVSARPGVGRVKQLIRRAVNWEIDPLARQITALQRATIDAVADLEARLGAKDPDQSDEPDRRHS